MSHEARNPQKLAGFAKSFWFGEEGDFAILVTELLGPTLEDLRKMCGRKFTLKTVLLLADQMIRRLEQFHAKHYIHRDIKPENFLIGTGKNSSTVYLIDFGLSKRFRDPVSGLHIPYRENKNFTGTARYASVATHQGIEQSRRDDLESLGYLFVYFLSGSLPWQNMPAANKKEKYEKIYQKKLVISPEKLCAGLPAEFTNYMSYCRKMKFNERPDYTSLLRGFKELFFQKGYFYDQIFDWTPLLNSGSQQKKENDHPKVTAGDIVMSKKPAVAIPKGMAQFASIMKQFQSTVNGSPGKLLVKETILDCKPEKENNEEQKEKA